MSDLFAAAVEVQKGVLRAQQAQLDAAQAVVELGLDAGSQAVAAQQAAARLADANARAWTTWANMWGWM